jgi:hypothetical protein
MNIQVYKLDDQNIKNYYQQNVNMQDCYSLTLTLNPIMYSADILTQYRAALAELKTAGIFFWKHNRITDVHPDFIEMIIVPELTKEMNIHFHGYFKCDPDKAKLFQNEFKKFTYSSKVFGRQHTFKQIDDMNDNFLNYPFKDIKELKKFPDSKKIYIIKFSPEEIIK